MTAQTMMTLHQAAAALGLAPSAQDGAFVRVTTDSRTIEPGDLFVALAGERFDGHDFAPAALEQGAAGVLVSRDLGLDRQIVAAGINLDSKVALGQLGHAVNDAALARRGGHALVAVGLALGGEGIEALAEGVETASQLDFLRSHGSDEIQGYYFSPPLVNAELEKLLVQRKCLPPSQ